MKFDVCEYINTRPSEEKNATHLNSRIYPVFSSRIHNDLKMKAGCTKGVKKVIQSCIRYCLVMGCCGGVDLKSFNLRTTGPISWGNALTNLQGI